jgi:thymidylate synthase ThyX
MDANYIFLCGVMWCRFGQQDAGEELMRVAESADPEMRALAWAMLAKSGRRLKVRSSESAFT